MPKPRRCRAGKRCKLGRGQALAADWFRPRAHFCKVCQAFLARDFSGLEIVGGEVVVK